MDFQTVMQQINKNDIGNVYTLYGTETYLRQQLIENLSQTAGQQSELEVIRYDMQEMTLDALIAEADTFSFFADKRLIIADYCDWLTSHVTHKVEDSQLKLLEKYLHTPNPESILLLILPFDELDNRKKITKLLKNQTIWVDLKALDSKAVMKYVSEYTKAEGLKLSKATLELLLSRVNYQLSQVMNEIAKLKIYSLNGQVITPETIKTLVPRTLEDNVFELTTAVLAKQLDKAVQIYQDLLLLRNEPIALHALLVSQFRLILQVKILLQQGFLEGEISKELNVHAYRVKLATQSAKNLQLHKLMDFYQALVQVDYQMKTGIGDKTVYFYLLLTRFMKI